MWGVTEPSLQPIQTDIYMSIHAKIVTQSHTPNMGIVIFFCFFCVRPLHLTVVPSKPFSQIPVLDFIMYKANQRRSQTFIFSFQATLGLSKLRNLEQVSLILGLWVQWFLLASGACIAGVEEFQVVSASDYFSSSWKMSPLRTVALSVDLILVYFSSIGLIFPYIWL